MYAIHEDIRIAQTLPGSFYSDSKVFDLLIAQVFEKSWQWMGEEKRLLPLENSLYPTEFLQTTVQEPLLLVKQKDGQIDCLSNVCTHRGNILIPNPTIQKQLICMYHGRRFELNGKFKSMPEFQEALDFPRACDSLQSFPLKNWNSHLFAGLNPSFDLQSVLNIMSERVGFLPIDSFSYNAELSKDYLVNCHWALYCDNYLEGFHIPFVHKDLNEALDYGAYTTLLYDHMNLQIGYSSGGDEIFDLPEGHPDFGRSVSAYYYWIFPNMMFNFYPWGLSINIVKPIDINRTKVSFVSYIYDPSKMGQGMSALIDKVEREDEFVVEGVQRGLKSKFYKSGRFSPSREKGVHQFQRLLSKYLSSE